MRKGIAVLILLILATGPAARAASWYAAPNASAAGNGSLTNPWSLHRALVTNAIVAGDTLYLRGGNYPGPFQSSLSGTPNNYVTVRSYPGEWAKITDTLALTLNTTLTGGTNGQKIPNVRFLGSETLPNNGYWVKLPGPQFSYIHNKVGSNQWELILSDGYGITNHGIGTTAYLEGNFIEHTGSYARFMDFEITATRQTNRVVSTAAGWSGHAGLNLPAPGLGNKAINLVIHNVGHPGIGFWNQGAGGEVNGCLLWGNGIYDTDGSWIRGNGIYAQNAGGTNGPVTVKNIIAFRNFTDGAKAFGTAAAVRDFYFTENFAFNNPRNQLDGFAEDVATSNVWFNGNIVAGGAVSIGTAYGSLSNTHQYVVNNIILNGSLTTHEHWHSFYTNNDVFLTAGLDTEGAIQVRYQSYYFNRAELDIVWDYNRYYLGAGTRAKQWNYRTRGLTNCIGANGSGNLAFAGDGTNSWRDWSGFDTHSTLATNWPAYQLVKVVTNDYNPNRWHVGIVSTTGTNRAYLDLATRCGFTVGQRYTLIDAQNWPTVVSSGTYAGGDLMLPLTLTNVSTIKGNVTHYVNKHTNIDAPGLFNSYVLLRNTVSIPTGVKVGE